jgi:quercetin dioxygenase-like cupin family protein
VSIKKTLPAAVFACLALATAHAQDPLKTEAKHYSLAFENETVQVLNVHYGPHEKSGMHDHPGGVVVILTGGHLRFTDQTGKSHDVFAKAGESRWFPRLKHSVENLGDTPVNSIYIGMRTKANVANSTGEPGDLVSDAETKALVAQALGSMKQ